MQKASELSPGTPVKPPTLLPTLDPNRQAAKDIGKLLLVTLLSGAGLRAGVGVVGNIRRNIRRKREREQFEHPRPRELHFESPKTAQVTWDESRMGPRPAWTTPAKLLGTPLAGGAGWFLVSKLMKSHRKQRAQDELVKAKADFEEALSEEHATKFSCDLEELASAYEQGELDEHLEKVGQSTFESAKGTALGLYLTALLLAGGAGFGGGWKLMGGSPQATRVDAYREAMRRRQISRPPSLIARTKALSVTPQSDPTDKPSPDEEEYTDKGASVKSAGPRIGRSLGRLVSSLTKARGGSAWRPSSVTGSQPQSWTKSPSPTSSITGNVGFARPRAGAQSRSLPFSPPPTAGYAPKPPGGVNYPAIAGIAGGAGFAGSFGGSAVAGNVAENKFNQKMDWLKTPEGAAYMRQHLQELVQNLMHAPGGQQFVHNLYGSVVPQFHQYYAQRHPILGRLLGYAV